METIRKLEIEDLKEIIFLRTKIQNYDFSCYLDTSNKLIDEETLKEKTLDYLKENLNKNIYLFGLFIDDELVANCGFYLDKHFPTYSNPNGIIGYICNVFTKEEFRKKGYQRKLFNYCLSYARKMKIINFKLSSKNKYAIKMYQDFGFKKDENIYTYKV